MRGRTHPHSHHMGGFFSAVTFLGPAWEKEPLTSMLQAPLSPHLGLIRVQGPLACLTSLPAPIPFCLQHLLFVLSLYPASTQALKPQMLEAQSSPLRNSSQKLSAERHNVVRRGGGDWRRSSKTRREKTSVRISKLRSHRAWEGHHGWEGSRPCCHNRSPLPSSHQEQL